MASAKLQATIVVALLAGSFGLGQLVARNHVDRPAPDVETRARMVPLSRAELPATDLDGEPVTIHLGERPRPLLALVLSVDCPFCERNMPSWVRLVQELSARSADRTDVVALSLSDGTSTRAYLRRHRLDVPARLIDVEVFRSLGLDGVPGTMVVRPGGGRARLWSGVLSADAREAVLARWQDERLAADLDGAVLPSPGCCGGPVEEDAHDESPGPGSP